MDRNALALVILVLVAALGVEVGLCQPTDDDGNLALSTVLGDEEQYDGPTAAELMAQLETLQGMVEYTASIPSNNPSCRPAFT